MALSANVELSVAVPVPPELTGGVSDTLKTAVPVLTLAWEAVIRMFPLASTLTLSVPPPVCSAAGVEGLSGFGEYA